MSLFKGIKTKSALSRLQEERLYEYISDELEEGTVRKGLWTKAIALAGGDPLKSQAEYINLRLQSMIDEGTLMDAINTAAEKLKAKHPKMKNVTSGAQSSPSPAEKVNLDVNMDDDNRYDTDDVKDLASGWLQDFNDRNS